MRVDVNIFDLTVDFIEWLNERTIEQRKKSLRDRFSHRFKEIGTQTIKRSFGISIDRVLEKFIGFTPRIIKIENYRADPVVKRFFENVEAVKHYAIANFVINFGAYLNKDLKNMLESHSKIRGKRADESIERCVNEVHSRLPVLTAHLLAVNRPNIDDEENFWQDLFRKLKRGLLKKLGNFFETPRMTDILASRINQVELIYAAPREYRNISLIERHYDFDIDVKDNQFQRMIKLSKWTIRHRLNLSEEKSFDFPVDALLSKPLFQLGKYSISVPPGFAEDLIFDTPKFILIACFGHHMGNMLFRAIDPIGIDCLPRGAPGRIGKISVRCNSKPHGYDADIAIWRSRLQKAYVDDNGIALDNDRTFEVNLADWISIAATHEAYEREYDGRTRLQNFESTAHRKLFYMIYALFQCHFSLRESDLVVSAEDNPYLDVLDTKFRVNVAFDNYQPFAEECKQYFPHG